MKAPAIALAILLLAGCSGKPSRSQMEEQVVAHLTSGRGGELFRIENFEKLNGIKKDDVTYVAEVRYDLVFKKGLKEVERQLNGASQDSPLGALAAGFGAMALRLQYGEFEAGQRIPKADKVTFLKTDNGWRLEE